MKITAKSIAALTLPEGSGDIIHFDEDLRGFGYRMRRSPSGQVNTTWVAQYRRAGASRRVMLGAGSVLTAEQARQAARKILAEATLGRDPQADKAERRIKDRLSLRSVIDEYLAVKTAEVRPGTLREITRYLTGPYFKKLHALPVDGVSRKDVASQILVVVREHGATVAALARATLSSFYAWAMTMGLTEANPVIGTVQPKTAEPRDRVLSDSELVAIWNACEDDEYGRIIRLLILVGARRREIGGIAWSELDRDRGTWTIPAARTKNGKAHTLPLMPAMLDVITGVPRMASRDHLFGARSPAGFCTWAEGKAALDMRSGVAGWKVHDIRRTVATKMADIGVAPHVIEQILNHVSGHKSGVAGIYNRSSYEREVRAALAIWQDHLHTLIEGDNERSLVTFAPAGGAK